MIATERPDEAAVKIAQLLGVGGTCTVSDATAELVRWREECLEAPLTVMRRARAAVASARAAAGAARRAVPVPVAGRAPSELRRAADQLLRATAEVARARLLVGPRPELDEEAAATARRAQADLDQARQNRRGTIERANRILAMGNGAGALFVIGRVTAGSPDAVLLLAGALPLGALALGTQLVIADVRRSRLAARRRWAALRSMDLTTMSGLVEREARHKDWALSLSRLQQAEARCAREHVHWESLTGGRVAPGDVSQVVVLLESARAADARVRAAEAAWAEAAALVQRAEDAHGPARHRPVVVLHDRDARRPLLAQLDHLISLAGTTTVVVVTRSADSSEKPSMLPAPDPGRSSGAGGRGNGAEPGSDLRDRALSRLRARLRPRAVLAAEPSPPGAAASGT